MKREETIFICDNCNRESKPRTHHPEKETRVFPYDEGWAYLHSMNFQRSLGVETVSRVQSEDRHFCCPKCLVDHVRGQFTEEGEDV